MSRIEQLQHFLQASPEDSFLHHALALEYVKMGAWVEALRCFERNRSADPDYLATYYHLGQLLEKLNRSAEAIEVYRQGMAVAIKQQDTHALSELRSVYEELLY